MGVAKFRDFRVWPRRASSVCQSSLNTSEIHSVLRRQLAWERSVEMDFQIAGRFATHSAVFDPPSFEKVPKKVTGPKLKEEFAEAGSCKAEAALEQAIWHGICDAARAMVFPSGLVQRVVGG
jgi:hypothetical protein